MEFDPENYQFTVTTLLEKDGQAVPHQLVWQAGFGDQSVPDEPKKKNAVYDADSKFTRVVLSGIKAPVDVTTSLIGAEDQYFISMIVLPQPGPVKISETEFNSADNTPSRALRLAVPGAETVRIYVGPRRKRAPAGRSSTWRNSELAFLVSYRSQSSCLYSNGFTAMSETMAGRSF
jgi:hypothetical protein